MIDRNSGLEATAIVTPVYPEWIASQTRTSNPDEDAVLASAAVVDGSRFVLVIRQSRLDDVTRVLSLGGHDWHTM